MRALNLVLTVLFQTLPALWRVRSDLILENLALRNMAWQAPRVQKGRPGDRCVEMFEDHAAESQL